MGFLTAGYNTIFYKLEQLRWSRVLQSVTRQHMKVQKQIKQQQSMMTQIKNGQISQITAMQQKQMMAFRNKLFGAAGGGAAGGIFGMGGTTGAPTGTQGADLNLSNDYQYGMQQISIWAQTQKSTLESTFEAFQEAQLEPLQQLEEQLTIEKENAQLLMDTAKQNYDAAKDERKATSKDMIAEYNNS